MILSDREIKSRQLITPFHQRTRSHGMTYGLGPAGYDVRIAANVILPPHGFVLASIIEYINMPNDLVAFVKDKSTWARQGIVLQNTVIEPGWRGFLTIEITNHTDGEISIPAEAPIAQIVFAQLSSPAKNPYSGKYQDQGPEPQLPLFDE